MDACMVDEISMESLGTSFSEIGKLPIIHEEPLLGLARKIL